jgi:hypothetical protein
MGDLLLLFYVPERSFMYLTVSSRFLISFVMGESSAIMLLKRTGGVVETSLRYPFTPVKDTHGLLYIKLPMHL